MPDAIGNLYRTAKRNDRKYGAGGRLLRTEDTKYHYDDEGNLIEKVKGDGERWRYRWHANGSLKEVIRPDRKYVVFKYDALGRRIQKTYGEKTTHWVWDGNTPLHEWVEIAEKPERKAPVTTWIFDESSFRPAAKLVGDKAYSIITDYLGTPVQAYDESGKLKWESELDIYGKVRTFEGDKALIPFRYQGQYEDAETGLYYNRFRYYSPDEGIYLSQDPIGLAGGNPTLYGYVRDVNCWVDEFGLKGDYHQITQMPRHQKHHIIPQSMKHPLLDRIGFDVHQSCNIVQLPTSESIDPTRTVHKGRHNSAYDDMILKRLDAIEALDASDNIKRMHVSDLMENVGDDLRNKRIKLNCH